MIDVLCPECHQLLAVSENRHRKKKQWRCVGRPIQLLEGKPVCVMVYR